MLCSRPPSFTQSRLRHSNPQLHGTHGILHTLDAYPQVEVLQALTSHSTAAALRALHNGFPQHCASLASSTHVAIQVLERLQGGKDVVNGAPDLLAVAAMGLVDAAAGDTHATSL